MSVEDRLLKAGVVSFPCSACGKLLKVKSELVGKRVKCSQCGQPVLVAETLRPSQSWLMAAVGGAVAVVVLAGGILLMGLWLASGHKTPTPAPPAPGEPYVSQLQEQIDKVKASKTREIDARSLNDQGLTITDRDLAALAGLTNLRALTLDGTKITDAGLKDVARVTSLEFLSLTNTEVTNAGLAELKPLTDLTYLRLDKLPISGPGLAQLRGLPKLRELSLFQTAVSDADLFYLKDMMSLEIISLDDTNVGNAGLLHLKGLTNLKRVKVWRTKVDEAGAAELRTHLPNVVVRIK